MISTTVYKYEYTGVVESWGKGWYNSDDKGVVVLNDPYFYMKEGKSIVGITTDNNTISISTVTDSAEKEYLKTIFTSLDPQ